MGHHGLCWQWERRPASASSSFPGSTCKTDALLQLPSSFGHVTNIYFPKKPRPLTSPVTDVLSHSLPSTFDRCALQLLWAENIVCLRVCVRARVLGCVLKLKVKTQRIWFKGVCAKAEQVCISLQWRLYPTSCVTIQSSPLTFFVWVQTIGRGREKSKGDL